jgi:ribosomal protein L29
MKSKAQATLQAMTPKELTKVLVDAKTALAILTMNRYTKQSKNVREGKALRQKIALVLTLLKQKEITHE